MRAAALGYLARGWSVIPIKPGTKEAARSWKRFQEERANEEQLRDWFGKGRELSLAVVCGEVSGGLVVRDFDTMESYQGWAAANPEWAKLLPTVSTHRGRHVYCRADLTAIRGWVDGNGAIDLGDGELRGGSGCYCLAPPSKHPDGGRYHWLVPLDATLPEVDLVVAGLLSVEVAGQMCRDLEAATLCPQLSGYSQSSQSALSSPSSPLHEKIEQIISRTLPLEIGQRHKRAFMLARELKALPELADGPAEACKPYVRQWYDRWPEALRDGFETWWWDFVEAWPRVRFPAGEEPMALIFTKAVKEDVPEVAQQYESPKVRHLVALCRELQRASGDQPFFLGCRTAGKLLGVDYATAWRWLRGLQLDKVLREVEKGSQAKRRASRYRYLGKL